MKLTKRVSLIGASAVLVLGAGLGTGLAVAAIPNSSTGELTACRVTGDAGNVRIIDKQGGASCHSYETELSWDTTPGITGYETVSEDVTIGTSGGRNASSTPDCPSGKKPVSGGFYIRDNPTNNNPEAEVFVSRPTTTGWEARGHNTTGSNFDFTGYVVCVTG